MENSQNVLGKFIEIHWVTLFGVCLTNVQFSFRFKYQEIIFLFVWNGLCIFMISLDGNYLVELETVINRINTKHIRLFKVLFLNVFSVVHWTRIEINVHFQIKTFIQSKIIVYYQFDGLNCFQ